MLMVQVDDQSIQSLPYGWIAILYIVLGVTRLVFFILDQNSIPGFFKGIPVPGAALLVAAPFIMLGKSLEINSPEINFWAQFCSFLMVFAAILMVSFPIRYMHIGRLMSRSRKFLIFTISLIIGFAFTPYFGHVALTYLFLYVLSPLYTWRITPELASREHPDTPTTSL